jgi:CRISPR-associated protein Cas1
MNPLLNTLYVTTPNAYIRREGETVTVLVDRKEIIRVPLHNLESIVCFGPTTCSTPLMEACSRHNVSLAFFSDSGRFYGRVQGRIRGNILLRKQQYNASRDPEVRTNLARTIVLAKIANARSVLLRAARQPGKLPPAVKTLQEAARTLGALARDITRAPDLSALRGLEGQAARSYFGVFNHLLNPDGDDFEFRSRSRRPPLDRVNALLSFVYALVAHDVESALEGVGLDPQMGFLHADRPGRPGLALDLMEELRPFLADRLVLTLVNRRQVHAAGFEIEVSGGVRMSDKTRRTVLEAYQQRKHDVIVHPFLEDKIPLGLIPHIQALLLARTLRGDLTDYPAFYWR